MKKVFLFGIFICFISILNAQSIDVNTAQMVAENFYKAQKQHKNNVSLSLYSVNYASKKQKSGNEMIYYYIFNDENADGFVLVAGDKRVEPVLGYSTEGIFDTTNMPDNLRYWLKGYEEEIDYAIANFDETPQETAEKWNDYIKNIPSKTRKAVVVGPLVQTKWGQSSPYNNLCPYDYNAGQRAVTGCVATAMDQIMKYWGYPIVGNGSHSYTHSDYGTLSANFANTTYQWSSMPNTLTSSSSSAEKNAVATLMYHCGVSVDMNYDISTNGGSSTFTYLSDYSIQSGYIDARTALNSYFRYTAEGYKRSDYTAASWISLLKNELNNARPILYSGSGNDGGHAFVCDGYNDNDQFHFNWGWDGQDDGYFLTNALNVGNYNFNSSQDIVTLNPNGCILRFYDDITLSQNPIYRNTSFTVSALIANYGGASFTGTISFDIYDATGNYMGEVGNMDRNLASLTYDNIGVSSTGVNYPAGTYYIAVWYKENTSSDWIQVREGIAPNFYSQLLQFQIKEKEAPKVNMQLAEHIYITPSTMYLGDILTVTAKITNSGDKSFTGKIGLDLYNSSGVFLQTLHEVNQNIGISSSKTINSNQIALSYPAGRYYVVATYTEQDSTKKIIGGAGGISNKTYFEVKSNVNITDNQTWQAILYPNPSTDRFIYETTEILDDAVAEIFDITGKSLYKTNIKDQTTIFDLTSFGQGVYILKVRNKDNLYTYKLVKQ